MRLAIFLLLGLLILRAEPDTAPEEKGGELQKPGRCPRDFTRCLRLEPPLCAKDSSCPSRHKCCFWECRLRCTPPAEEKPGVCPAAAPEGLFYPCSFPCLEDKDCLGAQKCCALGCGAACLEPVQDQPKPEECPTAQPGSAGPCWERCREDASAAPATPQLRHQQQCRQDQDCPQPEVCCHQHCSQECHAHSQEAPTVTPAQQQGTRCRSNRDCGSREMCCGGRCAGSCGAELQDKAGFCPAHAGLFPSYDCRAWCQHDTECPGEQKCCLRGCDYICLPPSQEKPGICPLAAEALAATGSCGTACAEDWQCPGAEKCCNSTCGRVCSTPEQDKPGECPKVRLQQMLEPCMEEDSCTHDRDCPRQEKCCFSGCAMRCTRPAREHPGECPRTQPCWDPRRRRRNQCLDDSVCQREEKCCDTGCGWACTTVPKGTGEASRGGEPSPQGSWVTTDDRAPAESRDGAGKRCVEECEADSQCPQGQRCTSIGCGRICMDIPGAMSCLAGREGVCPIPREMGTCLDLCSFDEECPWGHKCCSNGCGRVCTPASLQERGASLAPQHRAKRCREECEANSQCPWGQRCIRIGCSHICMDIPRGREGVCPTPGEMGTCLDLCNFDEDCPWGHKCCSNGCGRICTRMLHDGRAAAPQHEGTFLKGHGMATGLRWPIPSP
ncbi:latent-transforming growth factor beta-binding protein 4 isoform X5 [Cuculus canorus]|uniref:latent-transforming growth factor beta-binding protein 4 isoform X5 n=1 Tax=Cuculus canorus TaxID=55661 RepID=UPI0023AA62A2|nr:latent-transforming growth factor beta-binding protein 4 isoform X5 [Cuculus canorus]